MTEIGMAILLGTMVMAIGVLLLSFGALWLLTWARERSARRAGWSMIASGGALAMAGALFLLAQT